MAVELDLRRTNRRVRHSLSGGGRDLLVDHQTQALHRPACQHELVHRTDDHFVVPLLETLHERWTGMIHDHRPVQYQRVAGESQRIGFGNLQAVFDGNSLTDVAQRHFIKCGCIVHDASATQRRETGVQVIEPLVDQAQGSDFDIQGFTDRPMRFQRTAHPVSRPQHGTVFAVRLKQSVSFPFERGICQRVRNLEAGGTEPLRVHRRLRLSLVHAERTGNEMVANHQAGIGSKAHIRQVIRPFEHLDFGQSADDPVQCVPLLHGDRFPHTSNMAFHPRVDNVLHVEMRGPTHQNLATRGHAKVPVQNEGTFAVRQRIIVHRRGRQGGAEANGTGFVAGERDRMRRAVHRSVWMQGVRARYRDTPSNS